MEGLERNLNLDFMEDDEIRRIIEEIASFDPALRQKILALSLSLSHASSAFVVSTLARIKKARHILSLRSTEKWLAHAFDLLDAKGIDPFIKFISEADEADALIKYQSPEGLHLQSVLPRLETYIQGISGLGLKIVPGKTAHTDTAAIYLPAVMNSYVARDENLFIYKLTSVHQWSRITSGTLMPDDSIISTFVKKQRNHSDIESVFRTFQEREFAQDLYIILESIRCQDFLVAELPGLMSKADVLKKRMFEERPFLKSLSGITAVAEGLFQYYLGDGSKGAMQGELKSIYPKLKSLRRAKNPSFTFELLCDIYEAGCRIGGKYEVRDLLFLGSIRPDKVSRLLRTKRTEKKMKYEGMINRLLSIPAIESRKKPSTSKFSAEEREVMPNEDYLVIKGKIIELDSELREIVEERQGIPGGVLVKGSDLGAGSPVTLTDLVVEEEIAEAKTGGIPYDEWDYRRSGYKKRWCSVYEHDVYPGHEPFVEMTLGRYGAYIGLLRNKFEMLKKEPRLLRRQKDGDDIDIDASVEAFCDMIAGLSPADDLFIRLDRQERNIAVLFLLDMSGSTKGWVNEAEKESLVLMCEALEALGDSYAIYGFSGMTRTKCDFYRVKGFDEKYSKTVKNRIAGIVPKDYTRMGPAIRHSINLLYAVDVRTRLFVILSDGKPEDWDAYKGEYAIEDTRKALIEAREKGIHPFCITIDKEARSYLPHMYGDANYTVIDDVRKLPNRITEIYRRLTT
ncbi:MAG: nitric oxide reductase activation protein NorD [Dissulfurispiraceae bacterium]